MLVVALPASVSFAMSALEATAVANVSETAVLVVLADCFQDEGAPFALLTRKTGTSRARTRDSENVARNISCHGLRRID